MLPAGTATGLLPIHDADMHWLEGAGSGGPVCCPLNSATKDRSRSDGKDSGAAARAYQRGEHKLGRFS